MTAYRRNMFVVTQASWMLLALAVLFALSVFTLESYFILSFIGLLAVMQLYAPSEEPPSWWLYLRATVAIGFLLFGYVIYLRVAAIL